MFDLDGTLVDSRRDIVISVNHTLKTLGLQEKVYDTVLSYVGTGLRNLIKESLGKENEKYLKHAMKTFQNYYGENVPIKATLYKNVKETLEHFKDKEKIIITNGSGEVAWHILRSFGIDKYFRNVFGGDDESCLKPSPCLINKAIQNLNYAKSRMIMVGDMDLDILAGKAADVHTCAVTYGIGKIEDIVKARPDDIIDDIGKLKFILN